MFLCGGTWPVMLSQDTKVKNSGTEKLGRERITRSNLPDKQVHGLNAFQEFRHKNTLSLIFLPAVSLEEFCFTRLKGFKYILSLLFEYKKLHGVSCRGVLCIIQETCL